MGLFKKIKKTVKKATKAITKAGTSFVTAGTDAIKSIGKGDVGGILDAAARATSAGILSFSDKGLINPTSAAKTLGMSTSSPGGVATTGMVAGISKKKGLLSQLRQRKGGEGGGSFTSTAKDPLGGEPGKTGK